MNFSLEINGIVRAGTRNKWDFKPIWNSVHTIEYLAQGKALLARLYLKVKVNITKLLSVYNLQKISCLK